MDTALQWGGIEIVPVVRGTSATREQLRETMRHADIGMTGTDYALAETGSLVILPRRGLSRLVSLVPPVHIALVRPEEVLESLHDLFLLRRLEFKQRGGEMGSYLNFITGPSRTADIEMTIVQGRARARSLPVACRLPIRRRARQVRSDHCGIAVRFLHIR